MLCALRSRSIIMGEESNFTISGDVSKLCIKIGAALKENKCNRTRECKLEMEAKYHPTLNCTQPPTSPISRYAGSAGGLSTDFPVMSVPTIAI